ncbi:MAG: DUF1566 domain-containing protein [Desulfosudaceae bacterium]
MTRWTISNPHTVLDRQTGLVWAKDAALSEFPLTWAEALSFIDELNRSGELPHDDWRLPNRREMFSLVSQNAKNPSLPADHPFDNVFTGYYWTSTTCARLPDQAWYVHLGGARVFKGMKYGSYMVWPVRTAGNGPPLVWPTGQRQCHDATGRLIDCTGTGQDAEFQSGRPLSAVRFRTQAGTVCDHLTDLTWLQEAAWHGRTLDWDAARDIIDEINRDKIEGFDDWRLPAIRELESLTDMSRHSPALPTDHPFLNVQEFYWSATTSRYDITYAWVLYFRDGAVGVGHKPRPEFHLWPVRDTAKS